MSRETWNLIKQSKRFHINTFRRVGSALFVSVIINMMLAFAVYYTYFNRPEHAFYATSGVTPPVMLTSMDSPNYTSVALLAADPEEETVIKVIPQ
jgi:intracellular multiplication protein IcmM